MPQPGLIVFRISQLERCESYILDSYNLCVCVFVCFCVRACVCVCCERWCGLGKPSCWCFPDRKKGEMFKLWLWNENWEKCNEILNDKKNEERTAERRQNFVICSTRREFWLRKVKCTGSDNFLCGSGTESGWRTSTTTCSWDRCS